MNIRLGKGRNALSLSGTLAIAFLTLSVVVLVISDLLQIYANIRSQQEAITSKQQLIAQDAARTVSNFIQDKLGVLQTTARLASPADASPDAQKQVLDGLLGLQPSFRQIAMINTQGEQVAWSSRLSQKASGDITGSLSRQTLDRIRQVDQYISPVYIDQATSEPLTVMVIPLKNIFGDFQGALVAEVNLKFMWDMMDRLKVGENGYAYVVDDQGTLIAYKDTGRALRAENLKDIVVVSAFVNNPTSMELTQVKTFNGINRTSVVGTYVPLGVPAWAVVTEVPWNEAYQPVLQGLVWGFVIILCMAVLAGLVGVNLARRLAVPLENLMNTAASIAEGHTDLQAEVTGPREVRSLATAFNSMTAQLHENITGLEQRVRERTRALTLSTEVSRRLSAILDMDQLTREVVDEIQRSYNYYHVHIYLFDESRENLIMAGGTGEIGQIMLARGHSIPAGKGLVGRAALTKKPVLASDAAQDPGWLPNPLLPETRSELAMPIASGDLILGVLDVQQNVVGALTESDVDLIQLTANQVAIALQNAMVYSRVQQQVRREALISSLGQKIQQAATIDEVLQVAVSGLGQELNAQHSYVELRSGAQNGKN